MTKPKQYYTGVGRRKSAVAQVRIVPGSGQLKINGKEVEMSKEVDKVLKTVGLSGKYDVSVIVRGGGVSGQLDAINLGVSRAIVALNQDYKSALRKAGLLTRDARIKERKKPGLKKARRAPQWAKR